MVYVHTRRYRYNIGPRGKSRRSRKMYPVSYGPFADETKAKEWANYKGVMDFSIKTERAAEHIEVK